MGNHPSDFNIRKSWIFHLFGGYNDGKKTTTIDDFPIFFPMSNSIYRTLFNCHVGPEGISNEITIITIISDYLSIYIEISPYLYLLYQIYDIPLVHISPIYFIPPYFHGKIPTAPAQCLFPHVSSKRRPGARPVPLGAKV